MGRSTLISLNTTQAHIQTPSRMNTLLWTRPWRRWRSQGRRERLAGGENAEEEIARTEEDLERKGRRREERFRKKPPKSQRSLRSQRRQRSPRRALEVLDHQEDAAAPQATTPA